jgi:geranylgeranyl pyrophosphate synthase
VTDSGEPRAPGKAWLQHFLSTERDRVDQALTGLATAARLESPGHLAEPIFYALSSSGKRLRPVLCTAAFRAVGRGREVPAGIYRLSCALEIVHTYSLVHDDLPCMDDDDLRRGRPTVHRVYGEPRAIMAGAALLSLAVRVLLTEADNLGIGADGGALLVSELCAAAGAEGMVGGQFLDLEGEQGVVDSAGLERIHRGKTGALLTASLRIGAIAGGASSEQLAALTRYGSALGLAFQIADDVLDVVGETGALGKTAGRDEVLRKSSYPSLFGLDGAREMALERAREAKDALHDVDSPELMGIADFVVERTH